MTTKKPRSWTRFERRYVSVANAYGALGEACRGAGPLDERTIALAKLAISVGGNIGRTVHIHAKKALRAGVQPDAVRQIAVIALPTIGLPRALEALKWIDESIEEMLVERPSERHANAGLHLTRRGNGRPDAGC